MLKNFAKIKKGLTLVEILVVILIIAILIVALVPRVTAALDKAKETQVRTDFRNFSLAAESVLREYAGFSGVPLMDANGKTLKTIGEEFWNKGNNVEENEETAVTQSLIKAINRYLESSYQFDEKVTTDDGQNPNFGRSAAADPWKKPYEIYFVVRNVDKKDDEFPDPKKPEENTDKIYVTCNGKTQNEYYPDYSLLCEYHDGEVRTATAGFGDTISTEYATYAGSVNNKQYVLLASLFTDKTNTSGFSTPKDSSIEPEQGKDTIFKMEVNNTPARLFITKEDRLEPHFAEEANAEEE